MLVWKNILVRKKFLVRKKILVQKKFWSKKDSANTILVKKKKICPKNNFGPKNLKYYSSWTPQNLVLLKLNIRESFKSYWSLLLCYMTDNSLCDPFTHTDQHLAL